MNRQDPTTAHMFIINPFSGLGNLKNLFSTHPSTDDRIRELEKMAREQGVSVAPSKISGVCGRLKCCMGFENAQYLEVKEDFPAIGQSVMTAEGKGNVVSMNMLNDIIFVNIEGKGLQRYSLSEIKFNKKEKIEIEKTQVCCYEENN